MKELMAGAMKDMSDNGTNPNANQPDSTRIEVAGSNGAGSNGAGSNRTKSAGPRIRNIGIVAHVDAGKTTTTEQVLYHSGRTRSLGRVDAGTALTDWLDVEKERGISVRAATTVFEWKGCTVNLIDTPGHVDFSAEVERALRVLDGAILVISAAEGVQAHTETLWHALKALQIPTILFVNKIDRVGASIEDVLEQIHGALTPDAVPLQIAHEVGSAEASVTDLTVTQDGSDTLRAALAERNDDLLMRYLEGEEISDDEVANELRAQVRDSRLYPVLYGAALHDVGIDPLLDAIVDFLPGPTGEADAPVSGLVFKLDRDASMGRIAFVRLYQGTLRNRDTVHNVTQDFDHKVTQIRKVHAQTHEDVGELRAGDIAAVAGLAGVRIGDVLGSDEAILESQPLSVPVLTVQVSPSRPEDYPKLAQALQELDEEDPALQLQWYQDERELHVRVMGTIQVEVLTSILKSRFGLDVEFSPPSVIYKETPKRAGEGFVAYTMPKPCWAILRFQIEPLPRGSGLEYSAHVRTEDLLERYQNEVERRVPEALQQGMYGWEVTDLKVTLIEGQHHVWHTHPLDFVVATPMGIMDGLRNVGTQLLEPILHFRLAAPSEYAGRILGDLAQMRAVYDDPLITDTRLQVEGTIPVATSLDYSIELASQTGGRGVFATRFSGYQECPSDVIVERPRRGVNPLDTAKYILSVRNAISRE